MNNRIRKYIYICMSVFLGITSISCNKSEMSNASKLVINEVLIKNETNFQDDYGQHSAWIEIFNKSYGSENLAACYINVKNDLGEKSYFIPKGDVLTIVKPRQHALFWADGQPNRGTFHLNCTLDENSDNYIELLDSGKKLLDSVTVPAGKVGVDCSWARITDGGTEWEVKGGDSGKYVTPSTNNQTLDSNPKKDKFSTLDKYGYGMAISAMTVVFSGLLILFILFKFIAKTSIYLSKRNAMKAKGVTCEKEAKEKKLGEVQGEVIAAISMALHEMQNSDHDYEETVLTITRVKRSYSPWSSKIYSLRETPNRK